MHVLITGTRGVPSKHSGFETFAQDLALFLHAEGHEVTVYCQVDEGTGTTEDMWQGVRRVFIPAANTSLGTIIFDWKATRHSQREKGVVLTLGYNTGIFNLLYRFSRTPNLMNMDGIEWKREKWSLPSRIWFWINEWAGSRVATHLVADHPEIARHLKRHTNPSKITVIPYGADAITSMPSESLIQQYGLASGQYYLLIARPEPENSILEVVEAYSSKHRGIPLVVLGKYSHEGTPYQKKVLAAAGPEIKFLGAIFDRTIVPALRMHCRAYFHGHRVGGTNPSLVEALAASNAVIAHDNRFTRWVTNEKGLYFKTPEDVNHILDEVESAPNQLAEMRQGSRARYESSFTQEKILTAYENLLLQFAPK